MRRFVVSMFKMSIFAERLNELMIEKDYNSSTLADKLKVDRSTISRYLAEDKAPSLESLIKIADFFNCNIDFLIGKDDECKNLKFKECPPFSQRLKFLLKEQNKSQYALKKQTKISQSILYYWLHDKYTPSIDNLMKVAKFFDCTVDYLIGRSN